MDRTIGAGAISAERALSYGFTGPNLRAAGVDYDVRVAQPYSSYEDFDFIIPVGTWRYLRPFHGSSAGNLGIY
jgi:NADH-quinone oxidoreductase subunit D